MEINSSNLNDAIFEGLVLVIFYAKHSSSNRSIDPIISEIERKYETKLQVYKLDLDEFPGIASEYGITKIPSFGLFIEKKPKIKIEGVHPINVYTDAIDKLVS
jgi:thioredoxin 1